MPLTKREWNDIFCCGVIIFILISIPIVLFIYGMLMTIINVREKQYIDFFLFIAILIYIAILVTIVLLIRHSNIKSRETNKSTTCPYCGTTYFHRIGTCLKCGKKINSTMYVPRTQQTQYSITPPVDMSRINSHLETCPHCGGVLREGAIYCAKCGEKVE